MKPSDQAAAIGAFKPVAKTDKADATTRAAREIIDRERADRDAKTARLRALRLAKEASDAIEVKVKPAPKKAAASVATPKRRKAS